MTDDPNVLEIWNLVFIQFNREADGELRPLPARHVDTGMGLERVTSVLQGVMSNYATDLFSPIFDEIKKVTGARDYTDKIGKDDADGVDMAYRVVADHIRTLSFSIADGARPGSDGRDYVLRRILRRAVRYGREKLGAQEGFFAKLVDVVVANFGEAYPELKKARDTIFEVIREEEASFSRTLLKGIERFKKAAAGVPAGGAVSGADAFLLWDTYGFPLDLTQLMAEEAGLRVDGAGFEAAMEEARERSRAAGKKAAGAGLKFEAEATGWLQAKGVPLTNDAPKYGTVDAAAKVLAILSTAGYVDSTDAAPEGAPVGLVLDTTSFYAESGGQVGDTGAVVGADGATVDVGDCQVAAGYVLHVGARPAGGAKLSVGDEVTVKVDYERRARVVPNHTMTHVLNWALRDVLGDHVDQKGSVVDAGKLRFDFSNAGAVDAAKLARVEEICRDWVARGLPVSSKEVALADAKAIKGLRAVFGEVYPDPVRVVAIGPEGGVDALLAAPGEDKNLSYSVEFCGGTHLTNTAQAQAFALISEEGIAKGVRRVVAFTAADAAAAIAEGERLAAEVAAAAALPDSAPEFEKRISELKGAVDVAVIPAAKKQEIRDAVAALARRLLDAQRAAAAAAAEVAKEEALAAADAAAAAGAPFVVRRVGAGGDAKALAAAAAAITAKHGDALAALLLSVDADKGKVLAYAGVPDALLPKLKAPEWLGAALAPVGGKGGGKPGGAQGQGSEVAKADEALAAAEAFAKLAL